VKWELAKPFRGHNFFYIFQMILVYRSMMEHFHMKAFHISSANNCVADALSRCQFQKFKELAPEADTFPTAVPMEFWF
jgi:hypothetical protein